MVDYQVREVSFCNLEKRIDLWEGFDVLRVLQSIRHYLDQDFFRIAIDILLDNELTQAVHVLRRGGRATDVS